MSNNNCDAEFPLSDPEVLDENDGHSENRNRNLVR
jgi:hypothetical protein